MPRTAPESVTDNEGADRDRDRESNKSSNRADAEDSTDSDFSCKDKKHAATANEDVEPHGIYWSLRDRVYTRPETREGEAAVSSVCECDS